MTTISASALSKGGARRSPESGDGNGRQLINKSLSKDIFEAALADPELLQMCISRGMIREVKAPPAEPGFQAASGYIDGLLKTKGERYLEAVATQEGSPNGTH